MEEREEPKILMEVKEESGKVGLKLNIQNTKIMASDPLTSWQMDGDIKNPGLSSVAWLLEKLWNSGITNLFD